MMDDSTPDSVLGTLITVDEVFTLCYTCKVRIEELAILLIGGQTLSPN